MILTIFLFSSIVYSQNGDPIKYIAVNYTDLRIHTQTELPLDLFIEKTYPGYIDRDTITSDSLLSLFEDEFNKFTSPVYIDNCSDYRLVALVFRNSGKIDTLAVGECFVVVFNQNLYKPRIRLLKLFTERLQPFSQEEYYDYIKNLESYFECE
ncbi:MAG: hypothetical protein CVV22_11395 [Ignavibacteriae bacterium HGW-Ignavibacteriae-1]|jgi:hypothetical protein|nr:MAG: hypothetical protein CVV22_11395 [Ignavibacteriae bacterium HGW-Ignavibacteriae-1]